MNELLDSMPNQPEVNCDDVDIQEIEQAGINIYNKISDSITNINLGNAQYDLEEIYTEAQKIGIDVGDLVEYGFETGTNKCPGKYCLNKQSIKDFDDYMNKLTTFGTKLKDSSIYAFRRASCHP